MAEIVRKMANDDGKELAELAKQTFEKNEELYKGKSDQWLIRVTADELGMRKDDLCDILSECYGEE